MSVFPNISEIPSAEYLKSLPYQEFLKTDYWRRIAVEVKRRDGHRCRVCNSTRNIAAHHRTYDHHGLEHLHLGDLTTLCDDCHKRHHFPPPEREKVVEVVKTVVRQKVVEKVVREVVYRDLPKGIPLRQDIEAVRRMEGRGFFTHAAVKLSIKASVLQELGRETVDEMLVEMATRKARRRQEHEERRRKNVEERTVGDVSTVDRDMPPGDPIILTKELIDLCRTNGAFTSATARAFGLAPGKLVAGWPARLVGQSMPRTRFREAMLGRHIYAKAGYASKVRQNLDAAESNVEPPVNTL